MSSKSLSLMERRKQKLGNLQGTIQSLSVVDSKVKARSRKSSIHNLQPSMEMKINVLSEKSNEDFIQGELETGIDIVSSDEEGNINTNSNQFEEKYELTVKIGEGAHGVVSKCINKKDNRVYAAKTIRWEDEHFRFLRTNFINIRQLRHKSIIKYKALFINDKIRVCHTILEYFPHPSLKPGSMTEDTLKNIFLLIVEAVSYLHENSICHRDIKPDNILYDEEKKRMKIIDFGVSKNMKIRGSYETMLTDTGTFYYKAPEMFMGAGYTEAVDAWAIGISLYEMITGSTPFASEYLSDTKDNILKAEIDFENPIFLTYSPLVKDLISNLLKKDPKERISCEQAKNNLWFFSNIEEIDIRKSADIYMIEKNIKIKEKKLKGSLKRKVSLRDKKNVEQSPVTKN